MAWLVVQPNKKYALFSTIVDRFVHFNLTRERAIAFWTEAGLSFEDAEQRAIQAEQDPSRWDNELDRIRFHRGEAAKAEIEQLGSQ